jgi:hypothetical protein
MNSQRRRQLRFESLDQVIPDVARLLRGHVTVGRWSLGQMLHHLELAIRLPMERVPFKFPWAVRRLFGPVALRLALWLQFMPRGVRVKAAYLPPPGLDAEDEAERLANAIERFASFEGPFDEHPLLGRLTRSDWQRFHCLHCAHHLSFAIPGGR